MGRHLVLTVHGIGEQKPGETVDQVVGAATTWLDGKARPPITVEREMIELAESTFDGSDRNAKLFKVHLRKVAKPNVTEDEALFAEVFWADRSPAPKGAIKTVLDLIWVVLALGYLAMDNVEQTHRRSDIDPSNAKGRETHAARVVHLFTWIFFGAVATLNAYLLIGAGVVLVDLIPETYVDRSNALFLLLLLLYGGGAGIGLRRSNSAPTYLRRVFWRGMALVGGLLVVALLSGPLGAGFWSLKTGSALEQFVSLQVFALAGCWATLIVLTAVMYLTSMEKTEIADQLTSEHRRIYPSTCAAMLVFWMFFISGLWLTFDEVVKTVPVLSESQLNSLFDTHLRDAIETLSVAFAAIVVLALVGGLVYAGRHLGKHNLHHKPEVLSRAIVNRSAQWVFLLATATLSIVTYRGLSIFIREDDPLCTTASDTTELVECNILGNTLNDLMGLQGMIGIAVLGSTALLYRYSGFVAAGLGVARDIVTYAIRDKCLLSGDLKARYNNYPDRTAIDDRFYRALFYALDVFPADHITVVSHSQGTVIATQMLADKRVQRRIDGRPVTLITMGSPVTHIYQRYFPEMFTVDPGQLNAAWFNIFRQDDFVGTRIEGGLIDDARNFPVQPGGHTGYFTDYQVWKILSGDDIGFDLFHPKSHD
ncbi:hypothetical protein [uncultured Ruegeria sp.]|uniref:hypothetical protein n=1 Tax=uncultured Ruegeria sp. TaxID=259304 RepID=UPI0026085F8C|nr:hypothetical protein [uncultured Ruegeria sp.]